MKLNIASKRALPAIRNAIAPLRHDDERPLLNGYWNSFSALMSVP
jgi:hypothetical protein